MSKIQIITSSGLKYKNKQGVVAIKDGAKKSLDIQSIPSQPKPKWLKVSIPSGENYRELFKNVRTHGLNTVG